ncbi:MAG: bis(5'-nucleosyl)-tetraphosphatase (symmetrical) YqeK [Oscillospiraceae bacterium]
MTTKAAKQAAKRELSDKRFTHTVNVEKLARQLAKLYGEDEEKAALAALLHDIAKELPRDKTLQIFKDNAIIANKAAEKPQCVWHGIAAAILAKTKYNVDDELVLNAIAYHSTGRANMTTLDKIIYMADMTSDDRTYPEAVTLREKALKDLDAGMIAALDTSIRWLREESKPVDEDTLCAYESLVQQYYGGNVNGK